MMGGSSQIEGPEGFKPAANHPKGPRTFFTDQKAMYYKPHDISNETTMTSGRIFLGRLREDVDRQTLIDVLSEFGNVLDARIVSATKDGYKKRFAFCDLDTAASATAAIKALHGSTDLGEPLVATHSTDTKPSPRWTPISIGTNPSTYGLACYPQQNTMPAMVVSPPPPPPASSVAATSLKHTAMTVPPIKTTSKDRVFPSYSLACKDAKTVSPPAISPDARQKQQDQQQQFNQQHGAVLPPHVMHHPPLMPFSAVPNMVHPTPPLLAPLAFESGQITTLYVRGLPTEMDEMGLLHFYMPFGAIVATKILRNFEDMRSRGAGFVEFFTRQESDAALKATNRVMGPAGKPLLVHYAPRQLHASRAAARLSAPVWPVMPYTDFTTAAVSDGMGAAATAAPAVPLPFPVPAPLGFMQQQTQSYGSAAVSPSKNASNDVEKTQQKRKEKKKEASASGTATPTATPPSAAFAIGHPVHPQMYYNPYQQYHNPSYGDVAGWNQHPYPNQAHQQYYGYHTYQHHHQYYPPHSLPEKVVTATHNNTSNSSMMPNHQHHEYTAAGAVHQKEHVPRYASKPALSADSSSGLNSTTNTNSTIRSGSSATAVRRPGDPVVVVYGNLSKQPQQQQQQATTNVRVPLSPHYSYSYARSGMPGLTSVNTLRRPLRNLSINGGGGNGGSQSATTTPTGALPLGVVPQKHSDLTGNGASAGGNGVNLLGLERTSSDPFPTALSASEMEAICSRVKAAARNVVHANNAMKAAKKHQRGGGNGSSSGGSTPDIALKRIHNQSASTNTIDSEDSSSSVTDSVASCVTSAAPVAPAAAASTRN